MTMDKDLEVSGGMGRRTLLRRAAMGGALVWATPVIQTVGMSAAGASHQSIELFGCPGNSGPKPSMLRLTYSPSACGALLTGPAFETCESTPSGCTPSGAATITVRYGNGNFQPDQEGTNHQKVIFNNVAENTFFDIEDTTRGLGNTMVITIEAGGCSQTVRFHTSCSAELNQGDRYGSIVFEGGIFDI